MSLAFCATANALEHCLAQLRPDITCTTIALHNETANFTSLPECAALLLEAGPISSPSYQTAIETAVSMLAKQDKLLVLGPSIVSAMLLALPELALSPAAQGIHHVCSLRTTHHVRPLLQAVELRLLMLDGDAYAWYEPKQGYLRLNGNGYGVILTKKPIAGNSPAAVEINVLAAGMGQHW